jgi:hypothetical protein
MNLLSGMAERRTSPRSLRMSRVRSGRLPPPGEQPFAPRLSGTGSLRRELEAVLTAASPETELAEYRRLILEKNAAGKSTASARMRVWKCLKIRYLLDPSVAEFCAFAAAMRSTASPSERGLLCMLMLARTDRLFREVTLHTVSPYLNKPGTIIHPEAVDEAIETIRRDGRFNWSQKTLVGIRKHLLSSLKDFGVLSGARQKRTCRLSPGPPTTVFAAQLGRLEGLTDSEQLSSQWFRLLGLNEPQVVNLLYAATRQRALTFQMQAGVVELSLPEVATA